MLMISKGLKTVEQVLSKSLKEIQQVQNIQLGKTLKLSTGGTPLSLQIGKKRTMKTISSQTFYSIKRKHDLSDSTINSIAMDCRKDLGRLGVEANTSKKIKMWSSSLDDYYAVEKVEFTAKKKVGNKKILHTVIKDFVYVKDSKSLVELICTVRGLEVDKVIIRVGIDGQGSLKFVMNVFNIETDIDCRENKNTGVKKVLVLAFVKNVTENHANLQIIIEKIMLNRLKFYLRGKYSCLYCNGEKSNLGELRTFNKLKLLYTSFAENESKKCSMQIYKNVIHPCLLEVAGDTYVLDVVPPPELHLLMKIVTEISNVLCKEPEIAVWLSNHGIVWHGYNGGGLDGRNANKIRKLLPDLEQHIFDHYPSYNPVVELLKSFSIVVDKCFGMKLHEG
ncbi:uncharacterized protein LOC124807737 isoform X2 [Hydra vulgaris]|uniref:Uncharacterized protein LOC124807737 isoform X2 n=1 Tax=Hydra vulgaris TaxID=6087 RepID=A0ABM4D5M2_HYDVU